MPAASGALAAASEAAEAAAGAAGALDGAGADAAGLAGLSPQAARLRAAVMSKAYCLNERVFADMGCWPWVSL